MLDTRRLPIHGLEGWEVDARCRVFKVGHREPVETDWPYVTIQHHDLVLSFKAAEAAALTFLGEEGCSEIYRELFAEKVEKGHPRTSEIARDRGISEWIVLEAARTHYSQFRLTGLLMRMKRGVIDETMRLHRVTLATVAEYRVFPVGGASHLSNRATALYDHVIGIADRRFRLRQKGGVPMANIGDRISFSYRSDPQGGLFIVRSSFVREAPSDRIDEQSDD